MIKLIATGDDWDVILKRASALAPRGQLGSFATLGAVGGAVATANPLYVLLPLFGEFAGITRGVRGKGRVTDLDKYILEGAQ